MKGDLTWFKFRFSWIKVFKTLSNTEKDRLLDAIEAYTNDKEMPELLGKESVAWALIETELDADKESRRKAADSHREAGKNGGRPKTKNNQTEPNETKQNQIGFSETKNNQNGLRVKELRVKENEELKSKELICADAQIQPTAKPKKQKPEKHKYGSFSNVLLTDDEYSKLKEQFSDADERIENLSFGIASKGYQYKNHYATILAWARNDNKRAIQQQKKQSSFIDYAEIGRQMDLERMRANDVVTV